jgi:glucose-6-phosphate 1-dehydrogenase
MGANNIGGASVVESRFLPACDISLADFRAGPFAMLIFGGTGDLSRRKLLPTLYHLFQEEKIITDFSIIGLGRREMSHEEYRNYIREALTQFMPEAFNDNSFKEFSGNLFYSPVNFDAATKHEDLCSRTSKLVSPRKKENILYYLAVSPMVARGIIEKLAQLNMCKGEYKAKIIIEKPFGTNRASAVQLNQFILKYFDERQIYRIDHYLGKDTVQNILFFRFGNSIFEPLWDRRYIDHIQITVAEDIGMEHRGVFYEQAGVVRDIVQNHIMQLMALVAMEPPVGVEADLIRDEKVKVFKTIRPMDEEYICQFAVRGQYASGEIGGKPVPAYREEENVSHLSNTPTFMATKFYIDNWRWAGVPFYIRTGKRLARRVTEIYIQFKPPPLRLLGRVCDIPSPNALIFSIQPQEEISLQLSVKYPGMENRPHMVNMEFNYEKTFNFKMHLAYERLIIDAIKGDLTLFARQDGVEAMWSVVDPIIASWESVPAEDFPNYAAGTWGPKSADELIQKDGRRWREL